jgi:alkanesulfonate monooxygenase SsuD/methylene tetrahydromethanopterin reductase-like flavin-dependent oxidoreductase (luciferase family)
MVPLSILDLSPVSAGSTAAQALRNSLDLAQRADDLGFRRYWVAEHHNLPAIASSAPDIMIGQIAAVTKNMRIGSGGVMLPNHAPLMVAERFKVPLASPEEAASYDYTPVDRARIAQNRTRLSVGSPETVRARLMPLIEATRADELMVTTMLFDHGARKHSYELLAKTFA